MKLFKIEVRKTSEKDNFEQGCNGKLTDHGPVLKKYFVNFDDILKELTFLYGEAVIFDNYLLFQTLENSEGLDATQFEITQWRQGKIDLYSCNYYAKLFEVETNEIDLQKIETFKKLEIA